MKGSCIIFFLIQYVLCRNLVTGQAINQTDVTLLIYTQANPNKTEIPLTDARNITNVSQFNTGLKTVFYVHGWQQRSNSGDSALVRDALLQSANVNIIIVNWDVCAVNADYAVSKSCVPFVGNYVGQFVVNMSQAYNYALCNITVVGHSLGAHISGFIGKYTNGTLGIIVGLDPAGPLYSQADTNRLTESDATYVQAIHTNALFYGVNFKIGKSDFWPNGGYVQTGCGTESICSHLLAFYYYAESVTNNQFYAKQCDSYINYETGICSQNPKSLMGGINVNTSAVGTYYLDTNAVSPYGKGDV